MVSKWKAIFCILYTVLAVAYASNTCSSVQNSDKVDCHPTPGATQSNCEANGCCWIPSSDNGIPWCFYKSKPKPNPSSCKYIPDSSKTDCHPSSGANQDNCNEKGCCWIPSGNTGTPWCFYDKNSTTGVCGTIQNSDKEDCHPTPGANQANCESKGCCWSPSQDSGIPWCYYKHSTPSQQCHATVNERLDCYPATGASQKGCLDRSCCWELDSTNEAVPACFFHMNVSKLSMYSIKSVSNTNFGKQATASRTTKSPYPNDVMTVQFNAYYETADTLRLKIFDPSHSRYEVPKELVNRRDYNGGYQNPKYSIEFYQDTNSLKMFEIKRSDGSQLLKATRQNFIYSDQFIQITFGVPAMRLYGLGEHLHTIMYNLSEWQTLAMWTRDQPPTPNANLYGDQPFYLMLEDNGDAHGVLLMNSNAKEVVLQPKPAVTWRTIGGILDFYVFTGPTPKDVIQQYLSLIDKPFMVPLWGLGFHLCRYGYKSSQVVLDLVEGLRNDNFPEETQWTDIDYMRGKLDFTYDNVTFGGLPSLVENLHQHDQHYIMILDPGIGYNEGPYPALDDGLKEDVYIHNADGSLLQGSVWPGPVYFPDFTANQTITWWGNQLIDFHDKVAFNGIWIDMNEPSDFVDGSLTGCPDNDLNNPPYTPHILGDSLAQKTICPSSVTSQGEVYNTHDLYGHSEARASFLSLRRLFGSKRSMILTRSNFPGTGAFAAHWTGDNTSSWADLLHSISGILNYALFGIPFAGSDICGFMGATTEELCVRWMQLGSFYPFMRNHNTINEPDQDPLAFSASARAIMNTYVRIRYSLLPYLYTLFHNAHVYGTTVATPLFFNYPTDSKTYAINDQYLLGDYILVAPIINKGDVARDVYFPDSMWYDLVTGEFVTNGQTTKNIPAPLASIPVFVRGDSILVTKTSEMTIKATYATQFIIKYYIGSKGQENYDLYLDDGETYDAYENKDYSLISMNATSNHISWNVGPTRTSYPLPTVSTVSVFGLKKSPSSITVNGITHSQFSYNSNKATLNITGLDLSIESETSIQW